MDDITLEDLRQYQDILEELEAIRDEIRMIYIESPAPKEVIGGRSSVSTPGDPTARKAMKALERKERLENRERQLEDLQDRIEEYIDRMTDHHTAAIMRWHFIRGLTWRQTCSKVYGYPDPDICRMAIWRYFKSRENRKEGTDGTETD